jgi:branched-chain amino acid transport system ATP-binding protein
MGVRRTFQNLQLFQEATVRENVTLGLAYRYQSNMWSDLFDVPSARRKRTAARDEATGILADCGLSEVSEAIAAKLPYGTQKSVELARALAGHPQLLLLDEPTAGMNPQESRRVAETVRGLRDHEGISVLLIEHDMRVIMSLCDRIIVLDHGEKIAEGSPAEVKRAPAVMRAYLGDEGDHA